MAEAAWYTSGVAPLIALLLSSRGRVPALAAITAAVALVAPASRAGTSPLPVTEIAPGVFLHGGANEEASSANGDAIANIGLPSAPLSLAGAEPGANVREGRETGHRHCRLASAWARCSSSMTALISGGSRNSPTRPPTPPPACRLSKVSACS